MKVKTKADLNALAKQKPGAPEPSAPDPGLAALAQAVQESSARSAVVMSEAVKSIEHMTAAIAAIQKPGQVTVTEPKRPVQWEFDIFTTKIVATATRFE